jgi:hypothetical protein
MQRNLLWYPLPSKLYNPLFTFGTRKASPSSGRQLAEQEVVTNITQARNGIEHIIPKHEASFHPLHSKIYTNSVAKMHGNK